MKRWWRAFRRRPTWIQVVAWIIAVFVVLIVIGSATGSGNKSTSNTTQGTASSTSTPSSSQSPAPTSTSTSSGDTGRMSSGEYDQFTTAVDGVQHETEQFTTGAHKCSVIATTGDLGEFSSCMDDAYSGFNDKAVFADSQVEDLEGNVAKACLTHLRRYRVRLDALATFTKLVHDAGANLEVNAFKTDVAVYRIALKKYYPSLIATQQACKPS